MRGLCDISEARTSFAFGSVPNNSKRKRREGEEKEEKRERSVAWLSEFDSPVRLHTVTSAPSSQTPI